jgi:hypothetical protein
LVNNERQLICKLCRAGRKGAVKRRRADGKTSRSRLNDGSNPLRPVATTTGFVRQRPIRTTAPSSLRGKVRFWQILLI